MIARILLTLSAIVTLTLSNASADSSTVELLPSSRTVHVQDLANLAAAFGVEFKIFDYETSEPHCVHFFVEEITDTGDRTRHGGSGICGLGGPHGLTIQWQADAGRVNFTFMRYRRDVEQGSSVAGPTLDIPETGGSSLYGVEPPELQHGQETVLVYGSYGLNEGPQLKFKVLAELRANPDSVIGTVGV